MLHGNNYMQINFESNGYFIENIYTTYGTYDIIYVKESHSLLIECHEYSQTGTNMNIEYY